MSFVVHRVAKSAARYTDAGGREKCGYCRFFVAPRACGKVIGPVSPQGWCKYFSRQVAQQYSGAGISGGGSSLPPGVTLDLDFMTPGVLDPRITFTRASTATYTDASGVIQTAAVNQPRWDYDPVTHVLRGLLIEDASGPRAQDICFIPAANMVPWFASPGGSWFAEFDYTTNPLTNSRVIGQPVPSGLTPLFMRTTNAGSQFDGGLSDTITTTTANAINKMVSTWMPGQAKIALNAGPVTTTAALTTGYGVLATSGINIFTTASSGPDNLSGHIRRVSYWPRALSDAEMQAVTT